jgi:hypothetical protein
MARVVALAVFRRTGTDRIDKKPRSQTWTKRVSGKNAKYEADHGEAVRETAFHARET